MPAEEPFGPFGPCGPVAPAGPAGPWGPAFMIASLAFLFRSARRSVPSLTFWVLTEFLCRSALVMVLSWMSLLVISEPATAPPPAARASTVAAATTARDRRPAWEFFDMRCSFVMDGVRTRIGTHRARTRFSRRARV